MSALLLRPGLVTSIVAIVFVAGISCDDSGSVLPIPDAASDAPFAVTPEAFGRGEYLVKSVAGCAECHTPRDDRGNLDPSRWMAGVPARFDVAPLDDAIGAVSSPNLTPHATGLARWTDEQIRRAILDGVANDGAPLSSLMPSYVFHNMTDADARAIVVYLRSLQPIASEIPARQPLPIEITAPPVPIPQSAIPHTTLPSTDPSFARAEHGRYLAAEVGFCMDCHSPWRVDSATPLDVHSLFAGNRAFSSKEWRVQPPAPPVVYSYNVTPHASGIAGWTPATVAQAITNGVDDRGATLCRPMPSGPMGGFAGMTADDALDIGIYLTTLPPIDSGSIPSCPRE